jgi:hypothetical protein
MEGLEISKGSKGGTSIFKPIGFGFFMIGPFQISGR